VSPRHRPARRSTLRRSLAAALLLPAVAGGFALQALSGRDGERVFYEVLAHLATAGLDSLTDAELYEKAARGLVTEVGDPYADLFSPEQLAAFSRETLRNSYAGLGMQIALVRDTATVMRVFGGSPAEQGGVRAGDRIVVAGGQPVTGIPLDQVTARLLGPPGTTVRVAFRREGATIERAFTRERVRYPSVAYSVMLEPGIGYVPLEGFNDSSGQEVADALAQLRGRGATSFVFDLRGNTGGSLEQAIRISDLFLAPGTPILRIEYRNAPTESYVSESEPLLAGAPLVVLTDGESASASEIVAGALQDQDRAVIVGTTSFGKGLVQDLFRLDGGWALKLTTGRWYTPSGRTIQRPRRMTPDGRFAAEPVDSASRPVFRSAAGRTVYGGGGVTPDVVVAPDTLAGAERELMRLLAARGGAVNQVLQEMALDHHRSVEPAFRSTPAMRAELLRRLDERGLALDPAPYEAGATLVDRLLEARISELAFGDSASFRRSIPGDRQLQAGLRLLRGAPTQDEALRRAAASPAALEARS
jgi:carboxyl-terminal processing protease